MQLFQQPQNIACQVDKEVAPTLAAMCREGTSDITYYVYSLVILPNNQLLCIHAHSLSPTPKLPSQTCVYVPVNNTRTVAMFRS